MEANWQVLKEMKARAGVTDMDIAIATKLNLQTVNKVLNGKAKKNGASEQLVRWFLRDTLSNKHTASA